MDSLQYLTLAAVLITLLVIIVCAVCATRALSDLKRRVTILEWREPSGADHHYQGSADDDIAEYCLWKSRNGEWEILRECSAPGFQVGPPPDRRGRYESEIVRTRGRRDRVEIETVETAGTVRGGRSNRDAGDSGATAG